MHQHQFEFPGVRHHKARLFGRPAIELYVVAQGGAQEVLGVADRGVEIEQYGFGHVMAAEDEQLPGQPGRAVGSPLDLCDVLLEVTVRRKAVRQELGVAEDRLQQVVEVMGDPTGELPDRLHALSLPEALLGSGLTGEGLVELGIPQRELLHQAEGLVPADDGNVENSGEGQCDHESAHERDPGELVGQEPAQTRGETDSDHQKGDAMGLHGTLSQTAGLSLGTGARAARMGTSLTGRSLRALHRNPTATQLSRPARRQSWD